MTIKKVMISFLLLFATSAQAGGNVVGNGAGLAEHQFQQAYGNLKEHISFCLDFSAECGMSFVEKELLEKILLVVERNISNAARIIFVSEKDFPGFFKTTEGEVHRIAKTALSPEEPIYINRDFLYDSSGKCRLDYSTTVGLLIHEIGHQTGEKDHQILDILGAKLGKAIQALSSKSEIDLGFPVHHIEAQILTLGAPFRRSEIYLSIDQLQVRKVSDSVTSQLKCSKDSESLSSFAFYNAHFTLSEEESNQDTTFGYAFWADLYCFNPVTKAMGVEKREIFLSLNFQLETLRSRVGAL